MVEERVGNMLANPRTDEYIALIAVAIGIIIGLQKFNYARVIGRIVSYSGIAWVMITQLRYTFMEAGFHIFAVFLLVQFTILAGTVFLTLSKNKIASLIGKNICAVIAALAVWLVFVSRSYRYEYAYEIPAFIQKGFPFIISGGVLAICVFLAWKPFKKKARRILLVVLAGVTVSSICTVSGIQEHHRSILAISDADDTLFRHSKSHRNILLWQYQPFLENTLAKSLDEQALLSLDDNLPRLGGTRALYPLYAAFSQAVYSENSSEFGFHFDSHGSPVQSSNTSLAFWNLLDDRFDIIFLLDVNEAQYKMAEEQGVELKLTPIGREAFVFFVNSRNPVNNLSVEDVRGIYSGRINNWGEIGGNNHYVRAFQRRPGEQSDSINMLQGIMGGTRLTIPPGEYYHEGGYGIYRNYINAIGYSFSFYINEMVRDDRLKTLSINGIEPSPANISSGAYPFTQELYAVTAVREPETEEDAERMRNAERLIEWILSPQGQSLVEKTGYLPLQ
jgi:phosphate transport system substrate-binding protein